MRIIKADANFNRQYVLIEGKGEFEKYIENLVTERDWQLRNKSYDVIVGEHGIKGSRIQPSISLPYVMVVEVDDKHEEVIIDFIPKIMFEVGYGH